MKIQIKPSKMSEAAKLVEIYNAAFYEDYIRFHGCPGYGRTVSDMEESIKKNQKYTIYVDEQAVGAISVSNKGEGRYYIGCLCVIPEYQRCGIGSMALEYLKKELNDWKAITLETPVLKKENVEFYTKKCGFAITKVITGKTDLYEFELVR